MTRAPCAAGSTATSSTGSLDCATDPAVAVPGWASGSCGCWPSPRRGRSGGCGGGLAAPPCPRGPCTAAPVRWPGGGGPAWSPRVIPTATRSWPACARHRRAAQGRGGAGRRRDPYQSVALGPLDLDPTSQRQQVMTPGKNRRRTIFGAVDLHTGRWCYQVTRKAISATFLAFCEQLLVAYPAAPQVAVVCDNQIIHRSELVQGWLAAHPRLVVWHRGTLQPPRQPDRAHLGRAQGLAGQQPHLDDPGPRPPGARLLPRSQPHPAAGHRRTPQLTLAAQGLRTRLPGGRLEHRSSSPVL